MLNALPADKIEALLIAHNSNYGVILILECSENAKTIVKSNRFLQIKTTYYNPIQKVNRTKYQRHL